ncbi:MAG: hypothetical protein WAK96_02645 [Desulfobaccales bacterium]
MKIGKIGAIRWLFTRPHVAIARMAQANQGRGLTLHMEDGLGHFKHICKPNNSPRGKQGQGLLFIVAAKKIIGKKRQG